MPPFAAHPDPPFAGNGSAARGDDDAAARDDEGSVARGDDDAVVRGKDGSATRGFSRPSKGRGTRAFWGSWLVMRECLGLLCLLQDSALLCPLLASSFLYLRWYFSKKSGPVFIKPLRITLKNTAKN